MPAHRMNMRMIKDVLRLKFDGGFSHDRIAASLGISKGVVTKYLGLAGAAGLDWSSACDMDEGELERRLLGKPTGPAAYAQPDYGRIHQELRRKGMTLTLLWEEYQTEFADRRTYRYTQFCEHYRTFAKRLKRSMRQIHRAGEKLFVDFAGRTLPLTTGRRAHIFVAAMGASSYTFACATPTETMEDWLGGIARALTFYGGVPQLIVPDNPRAMIADPDRYEPRAGDTVLDFARHCHVRRNAQYICDRAKGTRGEPGCQSIAGAPIDEAVGALVVASMTPAAVELAWEIRREVEARHDEADQLRLRAIERAQFDADLAQRRFMLVDPNNRLVADTLEREWNDKLRTLADAREQRERSQEQERLALDDAIRDRLVAMTADFKTLWGDPSLANRERKRLLAYIVEDVTLVKLPDEGTTRIHVRFKAGKTETLTAQNPKSSAQQVKTRPEVLDLIDKLLDIHTCSEIAEILNNQGIRPGGCIRPGKADIRFTAMRVSYAAQRNGLRSRRDRLRDRGMLTRSEAASRLGIHEATLIRWVEYGLVTRHAYNDYAFLYEVPDSNPPVKHSSRWDSLTDRAAAAQTALGSKTPLI